MSDEDGHVGKTRGEFSVWLFFRDGGGYEYVRRFVSDEEAVEAAKHYTTSVAARVGAVDRVIITDGGDCACFIWVRGQGIVFPATAPGKE